jgi:hypothetical protein
VGFGTPATGTLQATVDWTFPSTPTYLAIGEGDCSVKTFPPCTHFVSDPLAHKPKKVILQNAPAGVYTLVWTNEGKVNEAIAYTVTLTH